MHTYMNNISFSSYWNMSEINAPKSKLQSSARKLNPELRRLVILYCPISERYFKRSEKSTFDSARRETNEVEESESNQCYNLYHPRSVFIYLFIYLFISDHEDPYQQLTYIHA